jgi:small ligand-binding sensory domain FIST
VSARFSSALSTEQHTSQAWQTVVEQASAALESPANLVVLFFSQHHAEQLPGLIQVWQAQLTTPCTVVGCTGESIAGVGREIEGEPAISLWMAALPETQIDTAHLEFQRTNEGMTIVGWSQALIGDWPEDAFLLTLAEPFSFPADVLLEQLHQDRPHVRMIGGMASGAHRPGQNRLILNGKTYNEGAIIVRMAGGVRLQTVVSQGCRPIGKPFVITQAERNILYSLGGKPALSQLQEIFATLPTREQAIARQGLHLGRVVNEYLETFSQGDFLVRNVTGIDSATESISIGDYFRVGQTVQFHIRDHESADAELKQLLVPLRENNAQASRGVLLFSCNGRGTRLFPEPHHDARVIQEYLGNVPLAGFFAQGEIGTIGNQNFLHGFTASIAIFEAD